MCNTACSLSTGDDTFLGDISVIYWIYIITHGSKGVIVSFLGAENIGGNVGIWAGSGGKSDFGHSDSSRNLFLAGDLVCSI